MGGISILTERFFPHSPPGSPPVSPFPDAGTLPWTSFFFQPFNPSTLQGGSDHVLEVSGGAKSAATAAVLSRTQKQDQEQRGRGVGAEPEREEEEGWGWGAARRRRRQEMAERQAFAVGVSIKAAPPPFERTKARKEGRKPSDSP